MRVVTPTDLRKRLGELLDAASTGERLLVKRDGRPLAMLVSVEDGRRLDEAASELLERRLAALDRLTELAERIRRDHPGPVGSPDAATAVRHDRDGQRPDG